MSDIRFNQWLHNSGTGGVAQDSTGHVGIGTTVPTHPNALTHNNSILAVGIVSCKILNASTTIEGFIDDWIQHTGDTDTKFGFPTDDTFAVEVGGSEITRITSSGLGINVTPNRELHVKGLDAIVRVESTSATGRNVIEFFDSSAAKGSIGWPASGNDHMAIQQYEDADMWFSTDDTERLRITSNGNVKINENVGIQTSSVEGTDLVGAGTSFFGAYIGDGMLAFHNRLDNSTGYYVAPHVNALNAGPITLGSTMTLDGTWVII